MSWICKAALKQCVCKEKLTEFVGYIRLRNRQNWKYGCTRHERSETNYQNGEPFPSRELHAAALEVVKQFGTKSRNAKSKNERNKYQAEFDPARQVVGYSPPDPE
jgi:hypothetical protein